MTKCNLMLRFTIKELTHQSTQAALENDVMATPKTCVRDHEVKTRNSQLTQSARLTCSFRRYITRPATPECEQSSRIILRKKGLRSTNGLLKRSDSCFLFSSPLSDSQPRLGHAPVFSDCRHWVRIKNAEK